LPTLEILVRRLLKLGAKNLEPVKGALEASLRKQSMPRIVQVAPALPPARLLPLAASRIGDTPDIERQIEVIARHFGVLVARRMRGVVRRLRVVSSRITNAFDMQYLREQTERYADPAARVLKRTEYDRKLAALAGKAAEGTILSNPGFVARVLREADEIASLSRDGAAMARLRLKSLDPTPLLFFDVRTAARKGSVEARQLFVDGVVLFLGTGRDGSMKVLIKTRVQSKLDNVDDLLPRLIEGGEFEMGQLAKDLVRAPRGPWHFRKIRIRKGDIIHHPGLNVVTLGTRAMTDEEKLRLRFTAGISVEHLVHDTPHATFFQWARAFLDALGVHHE
jgi:hypothetical protein